MTNNSMTKRAIAKAIFVACILTPALTGSAFACEDVFCKIGDGPKHFVQDIFTPNKVDPPAPPQQGSYAVINQWRFQAHLRVDCSDAQTGADRGDNTLTSGSNISEDNAQDMAISMAKAHDICQANGDTTRIAVSGTYRWVD